MWRIPSYLPASLCALGKNIMFWKRPYNVAYELSKVHYLSTPVRVCVRSRWPGVRLQTRVVYSLTTPIGILTPHYYFSPPRRAFAYILVYDAYLFYVAHLLTSKFTTKSDRTKRKKEKWAHYINESTFFNIQLFVAAEQRSLPNRMEKAPPTPQSNDGKIIII